MKMPCDRANNLLIGHWLIDMLHDQQDLMISTNTQ